MIHFSCPQCQARLKTDNHRIGRVKNCPKCNAPVEVPRSVGELVPFTGPSSADQSGSSPVNLPVPIAVPASSTAIATADQHLVNCPSCRSEFAIKEELFGHWINCPKCTFGFASWEEDPPDPDKDGNTQDEPQPESRSLATSLLQLFLFAVVLSGVGAAFADFLTPVVSLNAALFAGSAGVSLLLLFVFLASRGHGVGLATYCLLLVATGFGIWWQIAENKGGQARGYLAGRIAGVARLQDSFWPKPSEIPAIARREEPKRKFTEEEDPEPRIPHHMVVPPLREPNVAEPTPSGTAQGLESFIKALTRSGDSKQLDVLVKTLKNGGEAERIKAALAIGEMGDEAKEAIPALKAATQDSDPVVRAAAEKALRKLQKDIPSEPDLRVAALAKDLRSKDKKVCMQALEGLAQLGEQGKNASRDVIALALDPTPVLREKTLEALEKINPGMFRPVVIILVDNDYKKRVVAVRQIAEMGAEGEPAMPLLAVMYQKLLGSPSTYPFGSNGGFGQQIDAAFILRTMAMVAPREPAVRQLVLNAVVRGDGGSPHALGNGTPLFDGLRATAIDLAGGMGFDANTMVPILIQIIGVHEDRVQTINALARFGPKANAAIPVLKKLRFDPSENVRNAATQSLERIEGK